MTISRRAVVAGALAAPALLSFPRGAQAATVIKISHQFPSGTVDEGDFRDRLCRKFAALVERRTDGSLKLETYPGSSLMKTNAQFSSTRKGALAMTLYPLAYAGGELPETNIALMPALTTSYKQGLAWKAAPVGRELAGFLADKGIIIVSWIWQAGGAASRERQLIVPEDVKGMKVRGGSREMDLMLQAAGAAVLSLPSNELYAAMQTGACDAGITSSTSLISFRLEELSKHLTSGRNKSYWYMLEPLMMSRIVFEKLSKDEQSAIMAVGEEMETFGLEAAMADDVAVGKVFEKAGARVSEMDDAVVAKWRDIARATAWKDYAGKTALSARLMALAEQVGA